MPAQPIAEEQQSLWAGIKEALAGSHRDWTQGSLNRAIALLAIPTVLEMAMESLFAIVDIFFVARLGFAATTAVGATEGVLVIVFALCMGLSMGSVAVVARRTGEKDPAAAARAAAQTIWIGLGAGVLLLIVGVAGAPLFLQFMGVTPEVLAIGTTYARITLGTSGVILMLFLLNAVFRGVGDPAKAMRVLWVGNIVNMVLDPLLIYGIGPFPELGVTGAAVSTATGRSISVLYQLWFLFGPSDGRIKLNRQSLVVDWAVIHTILRLSGTAIMQFFIQTASWMVLVRLVQSFGPQVAAGYTIGIRVLIFTLLPSWGLGAAAATLVGQNLGAKQPERAERSVWRAAQFNSVFLGIVSVLYIAFAEQLVGIFTNEPAVIASGAACLRTLSYDYVLFAFGMVIVQAFNGAGDNKTPMTINLFVYWLFQLPLAYWLATQTSLGVHGVFWAIMIAEGLLAVIAVTVFRQGKWKRVQV